MSDYVKVTEWRTEPPSCPAHEPPKQPKRSDRLAGGAAASSAHDIDRRSGRLSGRRDDGHSDRDP
jgi:hypothetical protein